MTPVPASRPYVVLSCAMSVDGYIDDASDRRLLLSNEANFDRVDGERSLTCAGLLLTLSFSASGNDEV